jgi:putative oxidoreductase
MQNHGPLIAPRCVNQWLASLLIGRGFASETSMSPDRVGAVYQPYLLSLFRFVTGLSLFQFGVAKLFKFPPVPIFEHVTPLSLVGIAGTLELVLGGMLMLGLLTRPIAFVLSGEMAFAYFLGHFPKSFLPLLNGGTLAIMLCFACLYLVAAGGGRFSLDAFLRGGMPLRPDARGFGQARR